MSHRSFGLAELEGAPVTEPEFTTGGFTRAKRIGGPIAADSYRENHSAIARILREALAESGCSQQALADAAGITKRLVQQWLDDEGSNGPRGDVLFCAYEHGGPKVQSCVLRVLSAQLKHLHDKRKK